MPWGKNLRPGPGQHTKRSQRTRETSPGNWESVITCRCGLTFTGQAGNKNTAKQFAESKYQVHKSKSGG